MFGRAITVEVELHPTRIIGQVDPVSENVHDDRRDAFHCVVRTIAIPVSGMPARWWIAHTGISVRVCVIAVIKPRVISVMIVVSGSVRSHAPSIST
jgi:hypothetical protein